MLLGTLAIPILTMDNALALKVLLPYQLQQLNTTPLLKFQQLMGILYGIAGVAHFVDLVFGDSQILKMAGCCLLWRFAIEWSSSGTIVVCCGPDCICRFPYCGAGECRIGWIWTDGSGLRCHCELLQQQRRHRRVHCGMHLAFKQS